MFINSNLWKLCISSKMINLQKIIDNASITCMCDVFEMMGNQAYVAYWVVSLFFKLLFGIERCRYGCFHNSYPSFWWIIRVQLFSIIGRIGQSINLCKNEQELFSWIDHLALGMNENRKSIGNFFLRTFRLQVFFFFHL